MARGVPVVASPVGVAKEIIRHGENGILAKDADECFEALSELRRQPQLARRMGEAAHASVIESYNVDMWAAKLVRSLAGLAESRRQGAAPLAESRRE